ncbi:uncharacterized protein [Palaemon carinicauda]|uniref:uncharacterized protein n=1 Tax=Palaemon carinicauda TaxID=392227 RepID=UPI0035B59C39
MHRTYLGLDPIKKLNIKRSSHSKSSSRLPQGNIGVQYMEDDEEKPFDEVSPFQLRRIIYEKHPDKLPKCFMGYPVYSLQLLHFPILHELLHMAVSLLLAAPASYGLIMTSVPLPSCLPFGIVVRMLADFS